MAALGAQVYGLKETNAAFRKIEKQLAVEFGKDLKEAAEPVAVLSRQKVTRFRGASVRTIRTRRSGPQVFVEQGARKVTGKRGDFGTLQLRTVLVPALEEKTVEVIHNVDVVLDKYANRAGF